MREALVGLLAVALLAALEAAYHLARYLSDRRAQELRRRVRAIGAAGVLDSRLLRRGRLAASPALSAWLRGLPGTGGLERLLEQADSRLTVAQLLAASAAAALAGIAVGALAGRGPLLAPLLGAVAAATPLAAVLVARGRRSRRLSEQLPEALDMMARSLRAGHALPASFQLVAGEMPAPIGVEFARAFEEQKLGVSLDRAVQAMSARAPSNGDLKIFAVSTIIQRETGGNLAEILENIARTIRDRYHFFGKLRALTAEGRTSGVILALLPLAVASVLSVLNPRYLVRLVDNAQGQTLLATGIAVWVLGIFWLYRLTKVDY